MVSCTRTSLNTGSNTTGISVIVTQPRLSSSPLMSATISAWFGKYPEIFNHKNSPRTSANANTGKKEMFTCYHFPILHPQQIQKTQNLFVKLLPVQGDHWLYLCSLSCLWDFLNWMQVRSTKMTFLMSQLWGTQTKITLSSVTVDDRGTLPQ